MWSENIKAYLAGPLAVLTFITWLVCVIAGPIMLVKGREGLAELDAAEKWKRQREEEAKRKQALHPLDPHVNDAGGQDFVPVRSRESLQKQLIAAYVMLSAFAVITLLVFIWILYTEDHLPAAAARIPGAVTPIEVQAAPTTPTHGVVEAAQLPYYVGPVEGDGGGQRSAAVFR